MRTEQINPSIPHSSIHISGSARHAKSDKTVAMHIHNEFELLTIFDGKTEIHLNGKDYFLKSGDIIFINSRVPHGSSIFKDSSAFFVQFSPDIHTGDSEPYLSKYLSRFANIGNDAVLFEKGSPLNSSLNECLKSIYDEHMAKNSSYDIFIKSDVYKIYALLCRQNVISDPSSLFSMQHIGKIMPVLEYIDSHYKEEITLQDLCGMLNLNEFYFCRLFKKATNTSFVQYLNFVRVLRAERLLFSTDKSISEIAYEVGFSSVSYFNRTFKKYKFCSPSTYKKIKYQPRS